MSEKVNHPSHYGGDNTYEAIKVIEAWQLGFCDGNAIKYICRWRQKDGIQDLKKAIWYLNRLVEQAQKQEANVAVAQVGANAAAIGMTTQSTTETLPGPGAIITVNKRHFGNDPVTLDRGYGHPEN